MRPAPNDRLERYRIDGPRNTNYGAFLIHRGKSTVLRLIVSEAMGWDHVSVSLAHNRCPTWEEMCFVKDLCFDDEEVVMQLHPAKSQYVNQHPYCLHLWRPQTQQEATAHSEDCALEWGRNPCWTSPGVIPLPPKEMVGVQDGST